MILGSEVRTPRQFESTLEAFFILDAHRYQEHPEFPFEKEGREGGCQFAFDRDASEPLRCIECKSSQCTCPSHVENRSRYALQRFTHTSICVLDLDLTEPEWPNEKPKGWCKYWSLTRGQEELLREMESNLKRLPNICFFYRTKCNGFRVAFERSEAAQTVETYRRWHDEAAELVRACTPDRQFGQNSWFHVDPIGRCGQAFWSYPRVCNPIWLNEDRIQP